MKKFNFIVCGGTFDHFHRGHEEFLKFALSQGERLLIGLTTEIYLKKYIKDGSSTLEAYSVREAKLKDFFEKTAKARIEIVPIDDIAGPAVYGSLDLEAIIVTEQTRQGAQLINEERIKRNQPSLGIIVFPLIKNYYNQIISSSKIRLGKIDRKGNPYINPSWTTTTLSITPYLRRILSRPFGQLLQTEDIDFNSLNPSKIITVGDVVTNVFNKNNVNQKISVVDFMVQRKRRFNSLEELNFQGDEYLIEVNNPSGILTPSLWNGVDTAFSMLIKADRLIIKVNGEEDLSVLPLVLSSPLGFTLFYGQPNQGIVRVDITEEMKKQMYALVEKFEKLAHTY